MSEQTADSYVNEATEKAARIHAEFLESVSQAGIKDKKEAKKYLHKMYTDKSMPETSNVGPAADLRMRILAASLFPNIHNKKMVMTEYGSE